MMAQRNITDRQRSNQTVGVLPVNLGKRDAAIVFGARGPKFHQRLHCGYAFLVKVAAALIENFEVAFQVLVAHLRTFHRLAGANRYGVRQLRRMLLDGRVEPKLLGLAGALTEEFGPSDDVFISEGEVKRGCQFFSAKVGDLVYQMGGGKVRIGIDYGSDNRVYLGSRVDPHVAFLQHSAFGLFQHVIFSKFQKRVAFLRRSVFGLKFGTMKGHLLAAPFGLSAWVRNVSALRTLQSYTLGAHA